MSITINGNLDNLERDMRSIPITATRDMVKTVRDGIKVGRTVARDNAKRTARSHGKHYPNAITSEMTSVSPGGSISGEYGPDSARPQGGMSFEFGSRNQPPHLDLAKSADLIGPAFAQEVSRLPSGWFWL